MDAVVAYNFAVRAEQEARHARAEAAAAKAEVARCRAALIETLTGLLEVAKGLQAPRGEVALTVAGDKAHEAVKAAIRILDPGGTDQPA